MATASSTQIPKDLPSISLLRGKQSQSRDGYITPLRKILFPNAHPEPPNPQSISPSLYHIHHISTIHHTPVKVPPPGNLALVKTELQQTLLCLTCSRQPSLGPALLLQLKTQRFQLPPQHAVLVPQHLRQVIMQL